ncbi:MFS transporter [Lederbergia lenta]|uniref:Major facilitator superfamily protein n=1 Tax=Lederbergia lenta TaxID=1467 RepID=A0A2X4W361_LEDLE|nr:MFS transporter [Lederbergia lenta]MEC2324835.1 MFS transporter [Lederbergia lenta]SQI57493.1 major facilitator superfamily protein [Lederbergia lenta]
MATFFLIIIYMAFISLGLPDSMLGAAWPVMQPEYGLPLETAGFLYMVIAGGTIVSSLLSGKVIKMIGTGKVTVISVFMTAIALLGFSFSSSLIWLIICAIPLGLGGGAVDAALNNYVATHYKAHHMSWLHCFWGVGATLGPIIMSVFISGQFSWRSGYVAIAIIQFSLVVLLLVTLPLWNKVAKNRQVEITEDSDYSPDVNLQNVKPLQIKGVKLAFVSFFFYCGVEATMGLWGSSFLVNIKELSPATAAKWISFFYAGITIGRLVTGFITLKISNLILIRTGQITALIGAILLILPIPVSFSLVGFIFVGLGLAPIYPCMLHETPVRFGKEHSQRIMGYQMAVAYTGSTFLPPLLGLMASQLSIGIFSIFIIVYIILMLISSEKVNTLMKTRLFQSKEDIDLKA